MTIGIALLLLFMCRHAFASACSGCTFEQFGIGWWTFVTMLIIAAQWPVLALIARWGWGTSFAAVASANAVSGLCLALGSLSLGINLVVLWLAGIGAEFWVAALLAGAAGKLTHADLQERLLKAVVVMNVLTFWIVPAFNWHLARLLG